MLLSLLGTSLINAGVGESFKDTLQNIGLGFVGNFGTAIPSLFGSIGKSGKKVPSFGDSGLGRSLLENNKRMARIGLLKTQRNILNKARTAQGTINTYLSGRGFAPGGSTAMILENQNLNNAMEDIELSGLEATQRVLTANIRQLQGDYSMINNLDALNLSYESPFTKFMKESFVKPIIDQNLSSIGKKVNDSIMDRFKK